MVQATDFERHRLWRENALDSEHRSPKHVGVVWINEGRGWRAKIGELDGRPVCVAWSFGVVDGAVLCFYEATSEVVDYRMVREWADSIVTNHTNANNFNTPRFPGWSPNVDKHEAAHASLMDRVREEDRRRAELLAIRRAGMVRDPEVLAKIAAGIPRISDEELAKRLAMVSPISTRSRYILNAKPRGEFTWSPELGELATGLVPAKTVRTLHTYNSPMVFRPTIAEVLAQAPEDLENYVAFSIEGPEDVTEMNLYPEAFSRSYHVATVTYWRLGSD